MSGLESTECPSLSLSLSLSLCLANTVDVTLQTELRDNNIQGRLMCCTSLNVFQSTVSKRAWNHVVQSVIGRTLVDAG